LWHHTAIPTTKTLVNREFFKRPPIPLSSGFCSKALPDFHNRVAFHSVTYIVLMNRRSEARI
jgi:hypothetical protein